MFITKIVYVGSLYFLMFNVFLGICCFISNDMHILVLSFDENEYPLRNWHLMSISAFAMLLFLHMERRTGGADARPSPPFPPL